MKRKRKDDGEFPKRCLKCFYKSKYGDYCYIKPRATHGCASLTPNK